MADRAVLFIDCSYGFGGAIKSLGLTLRSLEGIHYVLTSQDGTIAGTWLGTHATGGIRRYVNYHTLGPLRASTHALPSRTLRNASLKAIAAVDRVAALLSAARLIRLCRRRSVALIHVNNGFMPYEAFVAARYLGIPCVVHLRDFADPSHCIKKRVLDAVSCVITVSDAVGEGLQHTTAAGLPRVTIHDPVDLTAIDRAADARDAVRRRHDIRPDEIAVGIFGRVIPWKGQREFLQAAIAAMKQDPRIRPVIIGDESDGGKQYIRRVHELAAGSGFGDRIVFAGYQAEVERYFAAMDIVVHASITPEPFGMVVPEAMAARCAVIAADAGGPREVITPGADGLLVPPGDVDLLAEAMLRLARDPAERRRLGEAGRKTVEERFGVESSAAAVRAVHDSLLGVLVAHPAAGSTPAQPAAWRGRRHESAPGAQTGGANSSARPAMQLLEKKQLDILDPGADQNG